MLNVLISLFIDFLNIAALPVLLMDAVFPIQNIDYEENPNLEVKRLLHSRLNNGLDKCIQQKNLQ